MRRWIGSCVVVCLVASGAVRAAPPFEGVDSGLAPMRALIERYAADRGNLHRFYDTPMSATGRERERSFLSAWRDALEVVHFDGLDREGRVDYLLFRNELRYRASRLDHDREREAEVAPLLPFAHRIVDWCDAHRRLEPVDPATVASDLAALAAEIAAAGEDVAALAVEGGEERTESAAFPRAVANRAARMLDRLRRSLREWFEYHDGYDPMFTWWCRAPYEAAAEALETYAKHLRKELVGVDGDDADVDADAIVGDPVGREELLRMLRHEMVPYTPEELVAIAEREYAWCLAEMNRASHDLGFGDDWRAALDHVKSLHVEPGRQPALIRDLAREAVEFIEARDLLTIPALCRETWRMEMMSPERQKVSPYFLGGESIIVSFPTDDMAHADKLMSLRGNNIHFSRAVVHHELIPGHHLQGFMNARYRTHRRIFRTPFWIEGWALYWEMLLWDLDFPQSAENRVGMLFWRMHRCARIVFSLSFHLGDMTPEEAIEYLVANVGHERNNATAEVRRSVGGDYGPLYQAAYMLGGLQIRALHRELVGSGRMTDRDFHDTVLRQNAIPIEMVRAAISDVGLEPDYEPRWRFYDE